VNFEKGKRAIITGASAGIGAHMARMLARRECEVVLVARRQSNLELIAEEIKKNYNVPCNFFVCDLSKEADIEHLIKAYPTADYLINNAGFTNYDFFYRSSWEKEKAILVVNAFAVLRLCHHYVKGMMERNFGRILNVASTAGLYPAPFLSTYVGAKSFIIQFSKSLALELRGYNVSVSTLMPGPTATDFWVVANMASKVKDRIEHFDSPYDVAQYGIKLMEQGTIAGMPGWQNKIKNIIKYFMPEKLWFYSITRHMKHSSLHGQNSEHHK